MNNEAPPLAIQRTIRLALLLGPVLLAVVSQIIQTNAPETTIVRPLLYLFAALFVAIAGSLVAILKPRRERVANPQQRFIINLIAWAGAEAIALFGGIIAIMGGPIYPVVLGILFAVMMAFVYFPVPSE